LVLDGAALQGLRFTTHYILDRQVSDRTSCTGKDDLTQLRRPTIWINDAWAANEILVKRAGIYSSRPRMLMFAELMGGQWNLLHMYTYTKEQRERFRDLRKITHHGVGIQQVNLSQKI
jgi:hypothetical protein